MKYPFLNETIKQRPLEKPYVDETINDGSVLWERMFNQK